MTIQAGCLLLLATAPSSLVFGDKVLPPVDVTQTQPAEDESSDSGQVTLSALPPVEEFEETKTEVIKALPPVAAAPAATKPSDASRTSRAMMSALRRGVPGPVKAAPPKAATKSVINAAVAPMPSAPTMRMNAILQTAGQDDEAGVISIPQLSEQLPPVPEIPSIAAPQVTPSYPAPSAPVTGNFNMKQMQRQTKRAQRQAKGNRFIEFYDPELERLDVDDYDRQTLLISQSEQLELAPAPAADLEDDGGLKKGSARKLFQRKITDIKPTLDYAWGNRKGLPDDFDRKMDEGEYVARIAPRTVLQWEPTNLWYHPLYFEDVGLERYGHTHKPWVQPFVSSGRFFGQVAMLPYQMTLHPPTSKEFALGHYQPGEWAPKKRYRIPFNEEATAVQFLWITGLVLLIP